MHRVESFPFRPEKWRRCAEKIAERLNLLNVRYGFSSAARGSDILFIEELTKIGALSMMFLPFHARPSRKHPSAAATGQV
jgi:hypothetical protein